MGVSENLSAIHGRLDTSTCKLAHIEMRVVRTRLQGNLKTIFNRN